MKGYNKFGRRSTQALITGKPCVIVIDCTEVDRSKSHRRYFLSLRSRRLLGSIWAEERKGAVYFVHPKEETTAKNEKKRLLMSKHTSFVTVKISYQQNRMVGDL